jgi:hypothetical protein
MDINNTINTMIFNENNTKEAQTGLQKLIDDTEFKPFESRPVVIKSDLEDNDTAYYVESNKDVFKYQEDRLIGDYVEGDSYMLQVIKLNKELIITTRALKKRSMLIVKYNITHPDVIQADKDSVVSLMINILGVNETIFMLENIKDKDNYGSQKHQSIAQYSIEVIKKNNEFSAFFYEFPIYSTATKKQKEEVKELSKEFTTVLINSIAVNGIKNELLTEQSHKSAKYSLEILKAKGYQFKHKL